MCAHLVQIRILNDRDCDHSFFFFQLFVCPHTRFRAGSKAGPGRQSERRTPRNDGIPCVPLPLPLSTGLLPMIHMAATVVLKQKGTCSKLKLFRECQRNNYMCVGSRAEGLV